MPHPSGTDNLITTARAQDVIARRRDRLQLFEGFTQAPKLVANLEPGTVNQAAMRAYTQANKQLLLSGTNQADAGCVLAAGEGVTVTTGGTANDTGNIAPGAINTGSTEFSHWNVTPLHPAKDAEFETTVKMSATITTMRVIAGLRLTAPATADETTDNDMAYFAYNPATSANWRLVNRRAGGTVSSVATSVAVAASTAYTLRIQFKDRIPYYWINDVLVGGGAAFASPGTNALKPVLTVQTLATATRAVTWHYLLAGRDRV